MNADPADSRSSSTSDPFDRAYEALMRYDMRLTSVSRNYPELFQALDDVLESLPGDATMREVLRCSVESTADGFGVQNMLLLIVEDAEPWVLRAETSRGLTREEVAACESGRSVRGVSATCIREALSKGGARYWYRTRSTRSTRPARERSAGSRTPCCARRSATRARG